MEREIAIFETVLHTATKITEQLKSLPKKKRNIFIKTYNRRPMKKKKTAIAIFNIAITSAIGAASIYRQLIQPIPKYPKAL